MHGMHPHMHVNKISSKQQKEEGRKSKKGRKHKSLHVLLGLLTTWQMFSVFCWGDQKSGGEMMCLRSQEKGGSERNPLTAHDPTLCPHLLPAWPPLGLLLTLAPLGVVTPWELANTHVGKSVPLTPTPIQESMSNCYQHTQSTGQGGRGLS